MSELTIARNQLADKLKDTGLGIDYESLLVKSGAAGKIAVREVVLFGFGERHANELLGKLDLPGGLGDLDDIMNTDNAGRHISPDEVYVVRVPESVDAALALGALTNLHHNGAQRIHCTGSVTGYEEIKPIRTKPTYNPVDRTVSPDRNRSLALA